MPQEAHPGADPGAPSTSDDAATSAPSTSDKMATGAPSTSDEAATGAPSTSDEAAGLIVELERGTESLGIDVTFLDDGACYIHNIKADGVVGRDGRIEVGDELVAVNLVAITDEAGALEAIRTAGETVELSLLRRDPSKRRTPKKSSHKSTTVPAPASEQAPASEPPSRNDEAQTPKQWLKEVAASYPLSEGSKIERLLLSNLEIDIAEHERTLIYLYQTREKVTPSTPMPTPLSGVPGAERRVRPSPLPSFSDKDKKGASRSLEFSEVDLRAKLMGPSPPSAEHRPENQLGPSPKSPPRPSPQQREKKKLTPPSVVSDDDWCDDAEAPSCSSETPLQWRGPEEKSAVVSQQWRGPESSAPPRRVKKLGSSQAIKVEYSPLGPSLGPSPASTVQPSPKRREEKTASSPAFMNISEAERRRIWIEHYVDEGMFDEADELGWDGKSPPDPRGMRVSHHAASMARRWGHVGSIGRLMLSPPLRRRSLNGKMLSPSSHGRHKPPTSRGRTPSSHGRRSPQRSIC